jgi:hypothetical protein
MTPFSAIFAFIKACLTARFPAGVPARQQHFEQNRL